jgi:uncharacterized protein (UPF0262 family)
MPIGSIRIEERLWTSAADVRRREWRTLITDVLGGEKPFPEHGSETLFLHLDEERLRLSFDPPADEVVLARAEFAGLIDEYRGVIDRLGDEGISIARMEALDMAKKVVHDEGARKLGALVPELSPHHETRRRFFSLVVALAVDTTGRKWAHRHF